jgi:hypothetical protein
VKTVGEPGILDPAIAEPNISQREKFTACVRPIARRLRKLLWRSTVWEVRFSNR